MECKRISITYGNMVIYFAVEMKITGNSVNMDLEPEALIIPLEAAKRCAQ